MSPAALHEQAVHRAVLLLSMAAFVSAVALRLCDPMLPALARSFATSTGRAAAVVTGTAIAYGFCQLLFGPLGDRYGKFRVVAWASLASTLGALASALSPSLDLLTLARVLNGATTAALIPLSMAWIGDVVPIHERQPTLARFMSGQILGLVSGQALGGFFADTLGWRGAFLVLALLYGLVGIALLRSAHRVPAGPLAAVSGHASHSTNTWARIAGVLAAPRAWQILAIVFVESMTTFGVLAFIPTYLHQRFGVSLFHAGVIVATFGGGGLLYTLFARRWVRHLGEQGLALSGGCLLGLAFLALVLGEHWAWGVVASVTAGLGFYQMHNTLQVQATQLAPQSRGTAVAIFAACFFLGQASGVAAGAMVLDHLGPEWLFAASAAVLPLLGLAFSRLLARRQEA